MRPLPRYVLAIMAGFVVFELWIPLLAIILRALVGPTIPTAVQAVVPLFGLAVPIVVALGLSDYLADRRGLVRPYQPKRRVAEEEDLADEDLEEEEDLDEDDESWEDEEEEVTGGHERPTDDAESADDWREDEKGRPDGRPHDRRNGQDRNARDPGRPGRG